MEIFNKNPQELVQDLKFSREGDYLRILSRRGDTLRPVLIPPGLKCEEPSLKFCADNLMQQNVQVDNLIANLEKRDNTDSQILFEGHLKKPQILFISVDLSDPVRTFGQKSGHPPSPSNA